MFLKIIYFYCIFPSCEVLVINGSFILVEENVHGPHGDAISEKSTGVVCEGKGD